MQLVTTKNVEAEKSTKKVLKTTLVKMHPFFVLFLNFIGSLRSKNCGFHFRKKQ